MAAGIVHGCEGSGSVQTLSQCFFDPHFRWVVMVNTAAVEVALVWLWVQWSGRCFSRAFGRCCHPRLPWTALNSWSGTPCESPTLGHLIGYFPPKDWLILFG